MIRIVLVVALLTLSQAIGTFQAVRFPKDTQAICLDSSPGGMYFFSPDIKGPNKLLIVFEDTPGGWCYQEDISSSLKECAEWNHTVWGSGNDIEGELIVWTGFLSTSAPGEFNLWHKVIIKSCDGGSYIGDHMVQTGHGKLHFKGSKIVEEAIRTMEQRKFIQNREEVVIAGMYNGAAAAMMWADTIQQSTSGKVRLLLDAGHYLNVQPHHKRIAPIQNRLESLEKIALVNSSLPLQACEEKFKGQLWKCFLLENVAPLVNFPVFHAQSFYDPTHLAHIVGYDCTSVLHSLSECTKEEREAIQDYSHKVQTSLRELVSLREDNGAWGISCVEHDILATKYGESRYAVPMGKDIAAIAIQKWLQGEKVVLLDEKDWPSNANCAHKLVALLTTEQQ